MTQLTWLSGQVAPRMSRLLSVTRPEMELEVTRSPAIEHSREFLRIGALRETLELFRNGAPAKKMSVRIRVQVHFN